MKILEMLLDLGFKDTGHKYESCKILMKDDKRIIYNPKDDDIEKYYKVHNIGAVQECDMRRLRV